MTKEYGNNTPNLPSKAIERNSLNRVEEVLSHPVFFPFVERIKETIPNGYCDAEEKIDIVVFTDEQFSNCTGLDTLCLQVKSSEKYMDQFLGVISRNGKAVDKMKFLGLEASDWVLNNMVYLDGGWGHDILSADIFYQICALEGLWPDLNRMESFIKENCGCESFNLMQKNLSVIFDYRTLFLDWVSKNSRLL